MLYLKAMGKRGTHEYVLLMGASPERSRYAFLASEMLQEYGHRVYCFGKQRGDCAGIPIQNTFPTGESFDTVTLYLNPTRQQDFYERILALKPKRVIFNPGTENPLFEEMLRMAGIEAEEACTLVLLRTGQF